MNKALSVFLRGIIIENPLAIIMIGLCSSIAVTTSVANGIGMTFGMVFVLLCSEIFISLFRKVIPANIRMPIFIVIIAAFTTMVDIIMKAYFPDLSKAMGVFIPLIVVNCIIMGRVEAFASREKTGYAILDA
ncbi:MAG: electron transport complex subunit RsxE, partial [Spirochaetales bacterium]|nr:electron transport complex subunit RsxE [Spirochaetales bacterium]